MVPRCTILLASMVLLLIPMTIFVDYFSTNAANTNLTEEQLIQIEKEPIPTLENCIQRQDFNPGDLCDSFYHHLDGKCKRLDYLPSYCGTVVKYNFSASVHALKLSTAQECTQDPPLPNETELVKICKQYVNFDSRYYLLPPELGINSIDKIGNESKTVNVEEFLKSQVDKSVNLNENPVLITINFTIKNPSIGGIHVEGITLNVLQKGKTILSDQIGSSQAYCASNYVGCVSYGIEGLNNYEIVMESKAEPGSVDLNDSKYLVNGSLDYKYDNSNEILSKSFSMNYP